MDILIDFTIVQALKEIKAKKFNDYSFHKVERPKIEIAELQDKAGVIGAALLGI